MGLDAYVGEMSRVDEDMVEFMRHRYAWCAPDDVLVLSPDTDMSDDVRELCVESDMYVVATDWKRLFSDFDIPDDWEVASYGNRPGGTHICFAEHMRADEGPKTKDVYICDRDMEMRYEAIEPTRLVLVRWAEVAYWREDARVRRIAKRRHDVANCGYYGLTPDEVREMCVDQFVEPREGVLYAYHEWY